MQASPAVLIYSRFNLSRSRLFFLGRDSIPSSSSELWKRTFPAYEFLERSVSLDNLEACPKHASTPLQWLRKCLTYAVLEHIYVARHSYCFLFFALGVGASKTPTSPDEKGYIAVCLCISQHTFSCNTYSIRLQEHLTWSHFVKWPRLQLVDTVLGAQPL